jgi:2-polyprenyl-3-methyl-5-hydroxy-6-metoxy-1,4-benzoquinol methylase
MNHDLPDSYQSINYHDSDCPSTENGRYLDNLDVTADAQGVAYRVGRYLELAASIVGPILEVGCCTGRICTPFAHAAHEVHGVDVSFVGR